MRIIIMMILIYDNNTGDHEDDDYDDGDYNA